MNTSEFLNYAIACCNELKKCHREFNFHGGLLPENIQWNPDNNTVIFSHPATVNTPEKLISREQLPYISPEQTGRMNRPVDYRTDFYSLGCVLYELLVGNPPFTSEAPLELMHAHLAVIPHKPHILNHAVPPEISAIIMKLLNKNSEGRYQSVDGLLFDLTKFRELDHTNREGQEFQVGVYDYSGRMNIPHKLYGREVEMQFLMDIFQRVGNEGNREILLVGGYSGFFAGCCGVRQNKPILVA